jgi:hypothetical protein
LLSPSSSLFTELRDHVIVRVYVLAWGMQDNAIADGRGAAVLAVG